MGKKEDGWARISEYSDKDGRRVVEFRIVEGPERDKKLFKGKVNITVRTSPDPRQPPQRVPFEFDFPDGWSFDKVRKNFDSSADAAVKQWENDQKKARAEAEEEARTQIVPAKGVPQMLGLNGKPLG